MKTVGFGERTEFALQLCSPTHCVILDKFLNLAFPTSKTGAVILPLRVVALTQ